MKKSVLLLTTMFLMHSFLNLNAQGLQNLPCTGYTHDVVANGNATSMNSTTIDCDGSGYVFVDGFFDPGSGICASSGIWPSNQNISSLITSGLTYTLQTPDINNDLVLWDNVSGTLNLITPVKASTLYALYTSGGAGGTVTATVQFTDNSTQVISNISTTSWCAGTSAATSVFNRTVRSSSTSCSVSVCQYMYEMNLAIDLANQSKNIQSITFSNSNGCVLSVFAVGGNVVSPAVTPSIPAQTTSACSAASFSFTPVNNPPTTTVPAGTVYSWTSPVVTGGITGGAASTGFQTSISGILTNPTNTPQTAVYNVIPSANGNTGAMFTLTVTINPLPVNAGNITGTTIVCQGQSALNYTVAAITNATNYIWTLPSGATGTSTTNNITINYGLSALSGNLTVKGNNSCGNGVSSSLPITVNLLPPTPVITKNGNILSSNASTGNQWYNQNGIINGATNQNYTALVTGNYYVIITINACSSGQSNTLPVTISGINEYIQHTDFNIYPNPVHNELIIATKDNMDKINFEILNSIGQIVFKGKFSEKTVIETSNFASGIYLIKFEKGSGLEFVKILKE
ncbi:MAG: T9SS type A sorting domain-containing protein [Bacteroidales bacterium]